jgi:hypothetical protein
MDRDEAIQSIINIITSEHDTGHDSEEVTAGGRIRISERLDGTK